MVALSVLDLAVVAVGCFVGTFWGNASGLIGIGVLLTIALAISTVTSGGPIGQQEFRPQSAQSVKSTYLHGVGELEVDLSKINRTAGLVGRTVTVKAGVGRTAVYLPKDLPVTVDVQLRAGDVSVFGREWNGPDNHRRVIDGSGPGLHLVVNQRVGDVEVSRR